MKTRTLTLIACICLLTCHAAAQQRKTHADHNRGYAFEGKNVVINASIGFFGYTYGYGKLSGIPFKLTAEAGVHRYVGIALYGGLLHRNPTWGERVYKMNVYTGGAHLNLHVYNIIDDLTNVNLRGDILDVYITGTVGADYFDTTLPLQNRYAIYYTAGLGVRAYPIPKVPRLGFSMEFSNILSPWLVGVTYRL